MEVHFDVRSNQLCEDLFLFFSKSVTSPPSQPVFAFVLSTRTALIVYQLHQYQEEPCESNIYSHLVSPL